MYKMLYNIEPTVYVSKILNLNIPKTEMYFMGIGFTYLSLSNTYVV